MSHRFRDLTENRVWPRPIQPAVQPGAFFACPAPLLQGMEALCCWQMRVYQAAFEQAQAVARPSILERDLLACWN